MKGNIKILMAIILTVSLLCSLIGCSPAIDTAEITVLTEDFIDRVIENDSNGAYGMMVSESCTEEEFKTFFKTLYSFFKDVEDYELNVLGWNKNFSGGKSYTKITYQVVTDDGRRCQLAVTTVSGSEGIGRIDFNETYNPGVNPGDSSNTI